MTHDELHIAELRKELEALELKKDFEVWFATKYPTETWRLAKKERGEYLIPGTTERSDAFKAGRTLTVNERGEYICPECGLRRSNQNTEQPTW